MQKESSALVHSRDTSAEIRYVVGHSAGFLLVRNAESVATPLMVWLVISDMSENGPERMVRCLQSPTEV